MEKYKKVRVIGRGAYGTVYLCNRISDNYCLIIKEIPVDQMSKDERQASLNEAKVLSMLDHPNIVAYHENFLADKMMVIVMEYAEGGTLYSYLQERKGSLLSEKDAMWFFAQLVLALQHVHSRSILHRDLKSQNIMLNQDKTIVKVGDFGISKILSSKSKAFTVVGTPYYISPELCEGKPYNQKSDIWALGCILYELLTLKRPFEADNLPALIMKIMQGSFEPLSAACSRNVKQLVSNMLHLDPNKRPSARQIMAQPFMIAMFYELYVGIGCLPPVSRDRMRFPSSHSSGSATEDRSSTEHESRQRLHSVHAQKTSCNVWFADSRLPDAISLPLPSESAVILGVSLGSNQKVGLTESNHVVAWKTESGIPDTSGAVAPTAFVEEKFVTDVAFVTCGSDFTVCLSRTGVLSTFGKSSSGCLAHEYVEDVSQPKIVEALFGYGVLSVACGQRHVIAISEENDLFAWGYGDKGCLGIGNFSYHPFPQLVNISMKLKICKVFCGPDCSFAVTEGKLLLACGSNRSNKLAMDTEDGLHIDEACVFTPVHSDPLCHARVDSVSAGMSHTAVLTEEGKVYTTGSNRYGQLGWGEPGLTYSMPGMVSALSSQTAVQIACGNNFTLAVNSDGDLFAWGNLPKALRLSQNQHAEKIDLTFLKGQRITCMSCNDESCIIVTKS